MSRDTIPKVRKILKAHIETNAADIPEEFKEILENDMFNKFREEIIIIEKERIREEAIKEAEDIIHAKKIKNTKWFIIQTIFLAFLVGLLINQFTDLININRSYPLVLTEVLGYVIIIFMIIIFVTWLVYLGKVEGLLTERRNN